MYDEKSKICVEPRNCYQNDIEVDNSNNSVIVEKPQKIGIQCNKVGCFCAEEISGRPVSGMKLSIDSLRNCENIPETGTCAHEIFITNENSIPMRGEMPSDMPYCDDDGNFAWRQPGPNGYFCISDKSTGKKMENTDFVNSDLVCSEIGLTTQLDLDFYRMNAAKFIEVPKCDLKGCFCRNSDQQVGVVNSGIYTGISEINFCKISGEKPITPETDNDENNEYRLPKTECERVKREYQNNNFLLYVPVCDENGNFRPIQKTNQEPFGYFCVDEDSGEKISGVKRKIESLGNCEFEGVDRGPCTVKAFMADDIAENSKTLNVPKCRKDGFYEPKQCETYDDMEMCQCVDHKTGRSLSYKVDISHFTSGDCLNDPENAELRKLTLCQQEQQANPLTKCDDDGNWEEIQSNEMGHVCVDKITGKATSGRKYDIESLKNCNFEPKNKCELEVYKCDELMVGSFCPSCDENGYEATQCHGSTGFCWCIEDKITGGRREETYSGPGMFDSDCEQILNPVQLKTKCELEREKFEGLNLDFMFVPDCDEDGNYRAIQCMNAACWCVKSIEGGEQNSETIASKNDLDVVTCELKLNPELSRCEQEVIKAEDMIRNEVMDVVVPECDELGLFKSVQYNPEMEGGYYCVDPESGKIELLKSYNEETEECEMMKPPTLIPIIEECTGDLIWNECSTPCPKDCSIKDIMIKCIERCDATCACPEGTILLEKGGDKCVRVEDCPIIPVIPGQCPETQVFSDCHSSCPKNCENKDDFMMCTADCNIGCGCDRGFVFRDRNSTECVPEDSCPSNCPANQVKSDCHDCPEKNCANWNIDEMVDCQICAMGFFCGCPEGMVRENEFSETCVKIEECPPIIFQELEPILVDLVDADLDFASLETSTDLDLAVESSEPEPEGEPTTLPTLELDNLAEASLNLVTETLEPEPEGESTTDQIDIDDLVADYEEDLNELIESISGDENTGILF